MGVHEKGIAKHLPGHGLYTFGIPRRFLQENDVGMVGFDLLEPLPGLAFDIEGDDPDGTALRGRIGGLLSRGRAFLGDPDQTMPLVAEQKSHQHP